MTDDDRIGVDADREELELRERLTVLEEWAPSVESALSLLGVGVIAMAVAFTLTTLILRKRLP